MAKSTPGQRARLYLQAHRDARMTALPGEHKAAREELMRQLEREDPHVRERALVGSDSHFDRPLEKGEKEYQRHFQREERLDHGQVLERRRALTQPNLHEGRRRPVPPRPAQHRARRAAQRTTSYVRDTAAAVAPPPVKAGIGVLYGALAAGVGLSMLYLLLTRTGVAVSLANLGGGGFRRLVSANQPPLRQRTRRAPVRVRLARRESRGCPVAGEREGRDQQLPQDPGPSGADDRQPGRSTAPPSLPPSERTLR